MITEKQNEDSIYPNCMWATFTMRQQIQILDNLNWYYNYSDLHR